MGATTSSSSTALTVGAVASGFASSFIGLAKGTAQLPIPNVLSRFASYNYSIGLSCLPASDVNFPDETYLSGKKYNYILKSASIDSSHRFTGGQTKLDFFITDLTINGGYGFEKSTGNTNSIDLEFTVVEPYSMGQFVTVMQVAAYNNNYPNYNEANYLLEIQFRGNTETGQIVNIAQQTKFIPIQIVTIGMKVNAGGATYHVKAIPTNAEGLRDLYTVMKSDTVISGETVQEILQSGPKSLQALLNRQQAEQVREDKASGKPRSQDQIYIIFPKDRASSGADSTSSGTNIASSATTSTVSSLQSKLQVSASGEYGIVKQTGAVNPIGLAKMDFDLARQGLKEFPDYAKVWDDHLYEDGSGGWLRANNTSDPKKVSFQFTQNTKIQDIINAVIQNSSYASDALKKENVDKKSGKRAWWRIDMQVYHVQSTNNEKITGSLPKIVVYRVIPYGVHASKMTAPNAGTPIDGLAKQVPKYYEYIYTGRNTEILNFDIEIKNTFISAFAFDNFRRSQDELTKNQRGVVSNANEQGKTQVIPEATAGQTKAKPAEGLSGVNKNSNTGVDTPSGTPGETPKVRAARLYHQALTEPYDMVNLNMKIVGDPFWIANSGMGNFTAVATDQPNVTPDASVDYQSSEVHMVVRFKSPTDIDQPSGLYKKDTDSTGMFSGLYKVITVQSVFKDGQFTQTLKGFRVPNQQSDPTLDEGSRITSDTKTDASPKENKDNLDPYNANGYNGANGESVGS
jgi:hypothetical protein